MVSATRFKVTPTPHLAKGWLPHPQKLDLDSCPEYLLFTSTHEALPCVKGGEHTLTETRVLSFVFCFFFP